MVLPSAPSAPRRTRGGKFARLTTKAPPAVQVKKSRRKRAKRKRSHRKTCEFSISPFQILCDRVFVKVGSNRRQATPETETPAPSTAPNPNDQRECPRPLPYVPVTPWAIHHRQRIGYLPQSLDTSVSCLRRQSRENTVIPQLNHPDDTPLPGHTSTSPWTTGFSTLPLPPRQRIPSPLFVVVNPHDRRLGAPFQAPSIFSGSSFETLNRSGYRASHLQTLPSNSVEVHDTHLAFHALYPTQMPRPLPAEFSGLPILQRLQLELSPSPRSSLGHTSIAGDTSEWSNTPSHLEDHALFLELQKQETSSAYCDDGDGSSSGCETLYAATPMQEASGFASGYGLDGSNKPFESSPTDHALHRKLQRLEAASAYYDEGLTVDARTPFQGTSNPNQYYPFAPTFKEGIQSSGTSFACPYSDSAHPWQHKPLFNAGLDYASFDVSGGASSFSLSNE